MVSNLVVIPLEELQDVLTETVKRAVSELQQGASNEPNPVKVEPLGDELMSIEEVAKFFRRSRQTIHEWKRKGLLPFHRISRKIYFKKHELQSALEKIEIHRRKF